MSRYYVTTPIYYVTAKPHLARAEINAQMAQIQPLGHLGKMLTAAQRRPQVVNHGRKVAGQRVTAAD